MRPARSRPFGQTLPRARTLPPPIVLDLELHRVPGVLGPLERHPRGALRFRLPGLQLEPLVAAEQHQLVALRDDADVAHLAAALHGADIRLDRVVAELGAAEERPAALGERERILGQLDEHLAAVEVAHGELAGGVDPYAGGVSPPSSKSNVHGTIGNDADARRRRRANPTVALTMPACAPAAASAVNVPFSTVPFNPSSVHVASAGAATARPLASKALTASGTASPV